MLACRGRTSRAKGAHLVENLHGRTMRPSASRRRARPRARADNGVNARCARWNTRADERAVLDDLIGRSQRLETLLRRTLSSPGPGPAPLTIEDRRSSIRTAGASAGILSHADVRVEWRIMVFRARALGGRSDQPPRNASSKPRARVVLSACERNLRDGERRDDVTGDALLEGSLLSLQTSKENGTGLGLHSRARSRGAGRTIEVQTAHGRARFE